MSYIDREIILSIYDIVADIAKLTGVLDQIAQSVDAKGCLIFEFSDHGDLTVPFFSSIYSKKGLDQYLSSLELDEIQDQRKFMESCRVEDSIEIISDEILYTDINEFRKRPNVQHVMQFGILHRAAAYLNKDNFNLNRFSIQFGADRDTITAAERMKLNGILPHLAKALDLGRPARQLAAEHRSMLVAMDRLTIGVCILDARGGIVLSNEEFKRQQQAHGVFISRPDGELCLSRDEDQRRFSALKSDVSKHGRFGARPRKEAIATDATTFFCIEVTPLTRSEEIGTNTFDGFILYSTDTSLPVHCNTLPMKQAFGLTAAELGLVEMIAEGLTNRQIAERRDRSVATINAQVKAILSKTHCSTRAQFVRLMMSFGTNYVADTGENRSA